MDEFITDELISANIQTKPKLTKLFAANDFKTHKLNNNFIGPPNLAKGRYNYLFQQVRPHAYLDIKFYIKNYTGFLQAILERCINLNSTLYEPLPIDDIVELSQYITNWVFAKKNTFAANEIGRRRSLRTRKVNALDKRTTANNMIKLGYGIQEIADTLGVSRQQVWRYTRIINS